MFNISISAVVHHRQIELPRNSTRKITSLVYILRSMAPISSETSTGVYEWHNAVSFAGRGAPWQTPNRLSFVKNVDVFLLFLVKCFPTLSFFALITFQHLFSTLWAKKKKKQKPTRRDCRSRDKGNIIHIWDSVFYLRTHLYLKPYVT